MTPIGETLLLLNPWWKSGKLGKELAKPFRREAFKEMKKLEPYRQIVILSGLRRVGKSTILYQIIEDLLTKIPPERVMYFTFDSIVGDIASLFEEYASITGIDYHSEKITVFLDEVTKLSGWASQIKIFYDSFPNIKFYLSSSSSILLEDDAVKNLAGRHFLINLAPLSFAEYLTLKGKSSLITKQGIYEKELEAECSNYLLRSFPETVGWKDELLIKSYIRTTVIDKIVKSDLLDMFKNANKDLLFTLIELFYKEPGFYLEYDNLSRNLGISKKTLYDSISYLESCYLIRKVLNFRPSTLSTRRKMQRVYPYWWNVSYAHNPKEDKMVESVVASTLDAKHYWRDKEKEIDFIVVKDDKIFPIEVKNKEKIDFADAKTLIFFINKYKTEKGLIVHTGKSETSFKECVKSIKLWKFLLE